MATLLMSTVWNSLSNYICYSFICGHTKVQLKNIKNLFFFPEQISTSNDEENFWCVSPLVKKNKNKK